MGSNGAANIASTAANICRFDVLSLKFSSDMIIPFDRLIGAHCRPKTRLKVVIFDLVKLAYLLIKI